jgi:hypothetical protein
MNVLNRLFQISSAFAMCGWLVLFVTPTWAVANPAWILTPAALLALIYGYTLILGGRYDEPDKPRRGGFGSMRGVLKLFESRSAVLAGWIHFLAFDLMVGFVIVTDSTQQGISHWLILPCLFLTLMFGPLGLLAYLILRFVVM